MGIILSYAVNDRKSFERVEFWMNQVQQHSLENTRKILIATKTDLPREEKMVGFDEGKALAGKYGIQFFETSSKTGLNVKESFCAIAKEVIEKNSKCKQRGGSNQENNSTKPNKDEKNMKLNASSIKNKSSKGGCC